MLRMRSLAYLIISLFVGIGALVKAWPDDGPEDERNPGGVGGQGLRIASLSPALTRTIQFLGLEQSIVGRSTYCGSIDASIPVVGDLLQVDYERLVRVAPTHVLVQPPATGPDSGLVRMADERGWALLEYTGLDSITDIKAMVHDLALQLDDSDEGSIRRRAEALTAEIDSAMRAGDGAFDGRVLLVHDTESIGACGIGTYLDELLVGLGARNALTTNGWVTLGLEDVVRLEPDGIIVIRTGPERAGMPGSDQAFASLGVPVTILAHPDVHYPAPTVTDVAEALDRALARLRILAE